MRFAGIDIGSRTIELVVIKDQEVIKTKQTEYEVSSLVAREEAPQDICSGPSTVLWCAGQSVC